MSLRAHWPQKSRLTGGVVRLILLALLDSVLLLPRCLWAACRARSRQRAMRELVLQSALAPAEGPSHAP